MDKQAWYNKETGMLIGWGYMFHREADGSESFPHVPVEHEFKLEPEKWMYSNGVWLEYTPPSKLGALKKCLLFARRILRR